MKVCVCVRFFNLLNEEKERNQTNYEREKDKHEMLTPGFNQIISINFLCSIYSIYVFDDFVVATFERCMA